MYQQLTFARTFFTARCVAPMGAGSWSGTNHDHVLALMGHFGIRKAFVPQVSAFSGRVATADDEMETIRLDDNGREYRTCAAPVEGGEIAIGEALMVGAAGCPFVVAYDTVKARVSRLVVAHAGRDSLIDRKCLAGEDPREHEGVLYAIAAAFAEWGIAPNMVAVEAFFSVDPEVFFHPFEEDAHAEANRTLYQYACRRWDDPTVCYDTRMPDGRPAAILDQPALLTAQAREIGFGFCRVQGTLPIDGAYPHTRHPVEAMRKKRSMIILHRTA